ncbi:HCL017Wp [Eremothecium sinecaudum]|uniref:HCL017Wp n=1 Tax=Eremothecium sinecaudum TaxID=45286 RepID=A0A0X8HRJ1_9SACH|nr:HCL017Wp [Eremothecium sinecaudum]AMD20134.1 HCL017Wp [Eremothecium sinecaudum]
MSAIAIKLGSLLIRQVTRPVANLLKQQAKQHAVFKGMCVRLAQRMHRVDAKLRMKLTPMSQEKKIRPLNEQRAVENGATLLSELFVFSVTGSIVIWESLRQRNKELARRDQVVRDIQLMQSEIQELKQSIGSKNEKQVSMSTK